LIHLTDVHSFCFQAGSNHKQQAKDNENVKHEKHDNTVATILIYNSRRIQYFPILF
jgi:hypothetical protein